MKTFAEKIAHEMNAAGRNVLEGRESELADYLTASDTVDVCQYYYFDDGSGVVWDGDEQRAHIINMTEGL